MARNCDGSVIYLDRRLFQDKSFPTWLALLRQGDSQIGWTLFISGEEYVVESEEQSQEGNTSYQTLGLERLELDGLEKLRCVIHREGLHPILFVRL